MPVNKGDFVEVSFEARGKGGALVEKTEKPLLIVAGAGQVIPGLDELLVGGQVGSQRKELIPASKAFGARDSSMVKLIPLQEFQKRGFEPQPGEELEVDGMQARVQSVNGGRVRLDFNHALAGMDLEYSFKIEKAYSHASEKVEALRKYLFEKLPGVEASFDEPSGKVAVKVPASVSDKGGDYLVAKGHFVAQLLAHVETVKSVNFNEEYARPAK